MKGLAYSSLRVGKRYLAVNYGEKYEFEIHKILSPTEFLLKDIHTLETFYMSEITQFGRGTDFEIQEIYTN